MIYSRGLRLRDLAERLACRLDGDGDIEIVGVAGIEQAGPGELSFVANPRYARALADTRASAVIVDEKAPAPPCAALRAANPYLAFANAVAFFVHVVRPDLGVHPTAHVAGGVELGDRVAVGALVSIGRGVRIGRGTAVFPRAVIGEGATIGEDCVIHAGVSIREGVLIGSRVVLQDGAVIGSDGFGFVRRHDGTHQKIPQTSRVVIEDDVEVGANSTIDRPAVGETRVKAGAKIDNLVQVAHGVVVGRNTLLCAQVGIAGSTIVGDDVVLAGQVGVNGHLEIGNGTVASGQTGITGSLDPKSFVSGYPAMNNREWRKAAALFKNLPALRKTVLELQQRVEMLERQLQAVTVAVAREHDQDP
jgi:UDP-3-O-[3-hydroxymyristoyl] glucosamine N-acyltransferase